MQVDTDNTLAYTKEELVRLIRELVDYCGNIKSANPNCECAPCRGRRLLNETV
jgi:hypothetical protein